MVLHREKGMECHGKLQEGLRKAASQLRLWTRESDKGRRDRSGYLVSMGVRSERVTDLKPESWRPTFTNLPDEELLAKQFVLYASIFVYSSPPYFRKDLKWLGPQSLGVL